MGDPPHLIGPPRVLPERTHLLLLPHGPDRHNRSNDPPCSATTTGSVCKGTPPRPRRSAHCLNVSTPSVVKSVDGASARHFHPVNNIPAFQPGGNGEGLRHGHRTESTYEVIAVPVLAEDGAASDPSPQDVAEGVRGIQARAAGHSGGTGAVRTGTERDERGKALRRRNPS